MSQILVQTPLVAAHSILFRLRSCHPQKYFVDAGALSRSPAHTDVGQTKKGHVVRLLYYSRPKKSRAMASNLLAMASNLIASLSQDQKIRVIVDYFGMGIRLIQPP